MSFATCSVKGEKVMTTIITGMKHLEPGRVVTQMIAFEPLCWICLIFFDIALIHSANRETMGYWLGSKVVRGFKVKEGSLGLSVGLYLLSQGMISHVRTKYVQWRIF
jgi:hypothetical protein